MGRPIYRHQVDWFKFTSTRGTKKDEVYVRGDGYEDAWAVMVKCPGCGEEVGKTARWAYDAANIARILREPEPNTARHDCPVERPAEVKQTPQGLLEASLAAQDSTERTALALQSIAASLVLMNEPHIDSPLTEWQKHRRD